MKKHFWFLLPLLIFGLFAMRTFWGHEYFDGHDSQAHLVRLYQYDIAIKDGQFPPKWAGGLYGGRGYPVFIFAYPLPYAIAEVFHLSGFTLPVAIKLTTILAYLTSTLAMYFLSLELWKSKKAGFLSAILWSFSPYMFVKIFITGSGIVEEAKELLTQNSAVYELGNPKDTEQDIAKKLKTFNPDALIVRQGKISKDVLEAATNLKVISKHGVGVDNIDIDAATRKGIPVMITPRANFEAVAEHALALIMALTRRLVVENSRVRQGIFEKKRYNGQELLCKTLGLIGLGRVGRRLVELVAPFRLPVLVYDPYAKGTNELHSYVTMTQSLEELLQQSDIVSLHCPLTQETKGLINKNTIFLMKQDAYVINTARGPIINENDLIKALQVGRIAGAGLDTFEDEPLKEGHPLLAMENVILTPHIAGMSDNSIKNMGLGAAVNVLAVLKGETPDMDCVVNKESVGG